MASPAAPGGRCVCVATCTAAVAARRSRPVQATLVAAAAVVLAGFTVTAVDLVAALAQLVPSTPRPRSATCARPARDGGHGCQQHPCGRGRRRRGLLRRTLRRRLAGGHPRATAATARDPAAAANALLGEERTRTPQLATEAERGRIAASCTTCWRTPSALWSCRRRPPRMHSTGPGSGRAALDAIAGTSRESLTEVRRVLGGLRTPAAGPLSLEGLPSLLDAYRSAGVDVELRVTGRPVTVDPEVGATAYLIAREALTNVLRHADGAPAVLAISYDDEELAVEVRDRGPGLTEADATPTTPGTGCWGSGNALPGSAVASSAATRPAVASGCWRSCPRPAPADDHPCRHRRRPAPVRAGFAAIRRRATTSRWSARRRTEQRPSPSPRPRRRTSC